MTLPSVSLKVTSDPTPGIFVLGMTQKVARVGIKQTLIDFAMKGSPTDGFKMLIERALPELTGEAVILRHQDEFDPDVVAAARVRLESAGIDTAPLIER